MGQESTTRFFQQAKTQRLQGRSRLARYPLAVGYDFSRRHRGASRAKKMNRWRDGIGNYEEDKRLLDPGDMKVLRGECRWQWKEGGRAFMPADGDWEVSDH